MKRNLVIYREGTVLFGNDGMYKLLKKDQNDIIYLFTPWEGKSIYDTSTERKNIIKLGNDLNVKIIWAVW